MSSVASPTKQQRQNRTSDQIEARPCPDRYLQFPDSPPSASSDPSRRTSSAPPCHGTRAVFITEPIYEPAARGTRGKRTLNVTVISDRDPLPIDDVDDYVASIWSGVAKAAVVVLDAVIDSASDNDESEDSGGGDSGGDVNITVNGGK